jgi:hypothetical protein
MKTLSGIGRLRAHVIFIAFLYYGHSLDSRHRN